MVVSANFAELEQCLTTSSPPRHFTADHNDDGLPLESQAKEYEVTRNSLGWGAMRIMAEGLGDLERSQDTTTYGRSALFRSSAATAVPKIDEDLKSRGVLEARSQDVFSPAGACDLGVCGARQ